MYTLTYIHKNGSLVPLFWKMFTDCLQMTSLNSQRKTKSAPPSPKIFLTYMKKIGVLVPHFDGFWCDIYNLFTKIDLLTEFAP